MEDRFAHVERILTDLESAVDALDLRWDPQDLDQHETLPEEIRYRLHVLACSVADYTFWVKREPQDGDLSEHRNSQMYRAREIESGGWAWGVTAREALENYFKSDVLDLPRITHHDEDS